MNTEQFKRFVSENENWFKGVHPETEEDLVTFEQQLGFPLPKSMKWLLSNYGYSTACGIENLEGSVEQTIECRESIKLPHNILLINDWGDGGLVFFVADDSTDTDYEIIWSDTADIYNLIEGKQLHPGVNRYENYPTWVASRLEYEKEEEIY
jgi:hypothetical protein